MKTLKETQNMLVDWGVFWYLREFGESSINSSMTAKLAEMLRTGIFSAGTKHQIKNNADMIKVPEHIQNIDAEMRYLTTSQVLAIKHKYRDRLIRCESKQDIINYTDRHVFDAESKLQVML